jgi:hypothetical protein
MTLPAFVTVNGRQYRGTTAFARGWVDADGAAITPPAYQPFQSVPFEEPHDPLAKIDPLADATTFADLPAAVAGVNAVNAKVTELLAGLTLKGYMAAT